MIHPPLKEFIKLIRKGNVIPVYKEINADLETPVSAFLKVAKGDYAFLLESVEGQEKIARFSFLGASPSLVFKAKGRNIEISKPAKKGVKKFTSRANPIDEVKKIMRDFKAVAVKGLPRFCGGLVGFIGYDTVRFFEELPDKNPDDLKTPDALLMLADTLLVFDHVNHNIKIVSNVILPKGKLTIPKIKVFYNKAVRRIEEIQVDFNRLLNENEIAGPAQKIKFSSNFKKREFENVVRQAKSYIKKGDIIQVVPSQRFKVATAKDPFMVYRKLRSLNPSPYMYFLRLKDMHLVGASPEMLVRCEDGLIQTRPIAGTRPRGKNEEEDARLARELINDKKERSEHLMLVDLGRNDLGRVSSTGTVEVTEFMNVEKYSHVMHLVSEVKGKLDNKRYDIYDVLKATFPAGTVSGSPKIRAMEIIDELENTRRGPYAGCVGYFSFSHNMDTCINIRTILIKGKFAYIQAGGGVVADSVPEKEYFETVNKAKALMEAIVK
ncbi:MAG: anthranilate synthase component I [Candidatus Omnitrophota bacterium]|jgi:anthranilate synthase component 1|nr:anthranilate synthase component I [Candidatus Omnitrophota bacterium]